MRKGGKKVVATLRAKARALEKQSADLGHQIEMVEITIQVFEEESHDDSN